MSRSIPVVKLSDYTRGTPSERERFVRTFGDGLKEFGFVTVGDHGIDQALIRQTYADARGFFELPEAEKKRYDIEGGGGQRGYTGMGREHAKNRTIGDIKEFWHVGRELPEGHPHRSDYGSNVWPDVPATFRDNTLRLYGALDGAASRMLEAIGDYFEVPRNYFADMATDGNSILRLIHYPPLKDRFEPGAVRAAEHEDINLITLLCESTSSGLEILTRQGDWLAIDALEGQIVVDSGDMLSRATNDILPATTHRVVNPRSPDEDVVRYSMPFFVHPFPECVLKAPDALEGQGTSHEPIKADAFLKQRLREIGLIK